MKLIQQARELKRTTKETDIESGACGREKLENNELFKRSGADEE